MEQDNSVFNPTLGEIGCRFRSVIEDHIKENRLLNEDDVEWLLEPLDAISHSADIVLGAFRKGDRLGWLYELYFHQRDASAIYVPFGPPYEEYNEYIDVFDFELEDKPVPEAKPYNKTMLVRGLANWPTIMAVPKIWDDLIIPFTEPGLWQALLLHQAFTFMPKGWHGCYNDAKYVFSQDDLQRIITKYSSYKSIDQEKLASCRERDDIMPSVTIDGDKAVISYCTWNNWSGFCRFTVHMEKHNLSVKFGERERETLVKYDCGIRF